MIAVVRGQVDFVYDDTNHAVLDPTAYYDTKTGITDWTDEEKEIFLDKFAAYPKQFGIIASFLPNKTPPQCVDYYYLHKKKFIDFRKVVQQLAPETGSALRSRESIALTFAHSKLLVFLVKWRVSRLNCTGN